MRIGLRSRPRRRDPRRRFRNRLLVGMVGVALLPLVTFAVLAIFELDTVAKSTANATESAILQRQQARQQAGLSSRASQIADAGRSDRQPDPRARQRAHPGAGERGSVNPAPEESHRRSRRHGALSGREGQSELAAGQLPARRHRRQVRGRERCSAGRGAGCRAPEGRPRGERGLARGRDHERPARLSGLRRDRCDRYDGAPVRPDPARASR